MRLNFITIVFRDILREKTNDGTPTGLELKHIMNSGLLISDSLAHELVIENIEETRLRPDVYKGVLLDGYPRTVEQAHLLNTIVNPLNFKVVNIKLETSVAVSKLLGRRLCKTCGGSFNTAHIVEGSFDMPAILPNPETCSLRAQCNPVLTTRDDDTDATITTRLQQHDANSQPILDYYEHKGQLRTFNVFKGVKDVDALIDLIHK